MTPQRLDLSLTCDYCGHESHLTVATSSLPDHHPINCALCGGKIGTLAEVKSQSRTALSPSASSEAAP